MQGSVLADDRCLWTGNDGGAARKAAKEMLLLVKVASGHKAKHGSVLWNDLSSIFIIQTHLIHFPDRFLAALNPHAASPKA